MKESKEKYKKLFNKVLDAIFIADAGTGIIIDCNRAASKLVGRNKSELIGTHQKKLHPPEEHEGRFSRTFKQRLKEKKSKTLYAKVITSKGEIKDVSINANLFELNGKKVLQGIFRDITEYKRKEKKLSESETRFRAVATSTSDLILEGDLRINSLKWFGDIDSYLGYEPGEFPRTITGHMEHVHPEDRDRMMESVEQAIKTGEDFIAEYRIRCKDGTYRFWHEHGRAIGFEKEKAVKWIGAVSDITEHKLWVEILYQSKKDWEDTFNIIPDMITIHDKDFNIIRANSAAQKILGLPCLESTKIKCFKYYHGTDKSPERCPSCKCFDSGKPGVFEVFEIHLDRFIEIRAIPRIDGNNKIIGLIHIVRNITGRKKTEEDLIKSKKSLSIHANNLMEANTALKVLLKQRENDKAELEEKILLNIKFLIMPYIEKLKKNNSESDNLNYVNILESNLNEIISSFSLKLSSNYSSLTPKEIQIANLIMDGMQSKDIAEILNLSFETVNCHRQNIRKKLGLDNTKVNLRSFLLSLSN